MDYTKIIYGVITLLVALADAFLIPYLRSKYTASQINKALAYVKIAVQAAEQIYTEADGPAKKQWVINYLAGQGIIFDEATLDAAIESAVLELHNSLIKLG